MDTRTLSYYVQVYKDGSISQAAKKLFLTQQGLCKILDNLEDELGVKLLERTRRGTHFTPDGEFLLRRAQEILAIEDECKLYFGGAEKGKDILSIACAFGTYEALGRRYVDEYEHTRDNVKVVVTEFPDAYCELALEEGRMDIGLTTASMKNKLFKSYMLARHPVCVVTREDFALAQHQSLCIKQLKGLPILLMNRDFHSHRNFMALCAAAGFSPSIQFEASEIAQVHRKAEKGEGVGITIKPVYEEYIKPNMRLIPLEDKNFTWDIYLTFRRATYLPQHEDAFCRYILGSEPEQPQVYQ